LPTGFFFPFYHDFHNGGLARNAQMEPGICVAESICS
jgi:hypothetical protein